MILLCGLFLIFIQYGVVQGIEKIHIPTFRDILTKSSNNALQPSASRGQGSSTLPPKLDISFLNSSTVSSETVNVQTDLLKQPGNPADGASIVPRETGTGLEGTAQQNLLGAQVIQNGPAVSKGNEKLSNRDIFIGSVHVDLPGQHGNPKNGTAVVHRVQINVNNGSFMDPDLAGSFAQQPDQNNSPMEPTQLLQTDIPIIDATVDSRNWSETSASADNLATLDRNQIDNGEQLSFPSGSVQSLASLLKISNSNIHAPLTFTSVDLLEEINQTTTASPSLQNVTDQLLGNLLKIPTWSIDLPPEV